MKAFAAIVDASVQQLHIVYSTRVLYKLECDSVLGTADSIFAVTLTVSAWTATCGSKWLRRRIIERKQSLAFFGLAPTLSQMFIITPHCSSVFFSLVAFSESVDYFLYYWNMMNFDY